MKEAMELNQKPSEMFELRNMAILKRYEAEKEQIEQDKGSERKQEELENLEELVPRGAGVVAEREEEDNEGVVHLHRGGAEDQAGPRVRR
jgi:hypothetical protein